MSYISVRDLEKRFLIREKRKKGALLREALDLLLKKYDI